MSKVKIQGSASGSGVLTIQAPTTSTDRTITLPDSTDTLAVNSDVTNKLPLAGGTMTGTLALQNNVSNSTSATLKLTGSSNATQDNFILFGDNATSVPIAMGFDNSENTFKIARNANDDLNSNIYFKMDSSGAVTMPSQPAFQVKMSSMLSNFSTSTSNILPFNNEIFDNNSDFNTSTYTFTAPITGKYQFNTFFRLQNVDTGASYYHLYFITSNTVYYDIISPMFTTDLSYMNMACSVLADMDANDTAKVYIYQAGGAVQTDVAAGDDAHFSGYLVC